MYQDMLLFWTLLVLTVALALFPKKASIPRPRNTNATPTHCLGMTGLLKMTTDAKMVKNFLVVVMMEVVSGPKLVIVMKMKFCTKRIQNNLEFSNPSLMSVC